MSWSCYAFHVMARHSRLKDGVASARLCPAIHVFSSKAWMPGTRPGMTVKFSEQLPHRHGGIRHAVGKAPFIVVPRHHPHQRAVLHLGLVHVEGGGMPVSYTHLTLPTIY